jgi:hypothetical protein
MIAADQRICHGQESSHETILEEGEADQTSAIRLACGKSHPEAQLEVDPDEPEPQLAQQG